MAAELTGAFAWKPQHLSDVPAFSDEEGGEAAAAKPTTPEHVSPVVWPPQSPDALGLQRPSSLEASVAAAGGSGGGGSGIEARGRFRKRAAGRGGDKAPAASDEAPAANTQAVAGRGAGVQPAARSQKREDGWLPKAEYEAKKREERARRQREREQASSGSAGGKGAASGGKGARRQMLWDSLPKPPDPPKDTPEARKQREAEEAQLRARDMLRGAASAEEMRVAIAAAQELGLVEEVRLGERKLAKMVSAP